MGASFFEIVQHIKNHLQSYINEKFKDIKLSSAEFFVIRSIDEHQRLSQIEISRILSCDKAHIHRISRKLIDKNLVCYIDNNEKTKNCKLELTNNGKLVAREYKSFINRTFDELLNGIREQDLLTARKVMAEITQNIKRLKLEK